jgi:hypothetical protein
MSSALFLHDTHDTFFLHCTPHARRPLRRRQPVVLKHRGGRALDFAVHVNDGHILEVFGPNLERPSRNAPGLPAWTAVLRQINQFASDHRQA